MDCDSISAGFNFWLGKTLAEALIGVGVVVLCLVVIVTVVYFGRRGRG